MTTLLINFGILLFLAFLLSVWVRIKVVFDGDTRVFLRVLFIKKQIFPQRDKKARVIKDKKKGRKKKEKPDKEGKGIPKKEISTLENIKNITSAVMEVLRRFPKYLRIDFSRIIIKVSSDDAAKTAVEYGIVMQAVTYLIEILDNITNIKFKRKSEINVYADFSSAKSEIKADITFRLRVIHIIVLALRGAGVYIKRNNMNKNTDNIK